MSNFKQCRECKNQHYHFSCPFNQLDSKVQDYLRKEGKYDCKKFEQKPLPPPPMTHEEYSNKQKEILKDIPEEFHGTFSAMSYERGHSAGYEECICHLKGLVSDLKDPIKKFQERLLKQ